MFKISESQAKERLGQVIINKQDERMKIIKYNNSRDIDIQFLDTNNIVYHQCYSNFKKELLLIIFYLQNLSMEL